MEPKRPTLGENFERVAPALTVVMLLIGLVAVVYLETNRPVAPTGNLRYFSSETEMARYLNSADGGDSNNLFGAQAGGGPEVAGGDRLVTMGDTTPPPSTAPGEGFSGTNVQVAGVDEGDIVKTDGNAIYVASGGDVVLLDARPAADMAVMSRIELDTWTSELYIAEGRLIVVTHGFPYYMLGGGVGIARGSPVCESCDVMFNYYPYETNVRVYDVTDLTAPAMVQNITLPGWFAGSRMIGDWTYILTTEYVYYEDDDVILPAVAVDGVRTPLQPRDIGYFDDGTYATTILTVAAVNAQDPGGFNHESFLVGGVQTVYVSLTDLYVTSPTYVWGERSTTTTWIFRLGLAAGTIAYEADGQVPGWVLNQFSIDEYEGHLRIATTDGWGDDAANNVYVLDEDLAVQGRIENLAPGERIFSARFVGERGYIVTFRQIDPLFVLDLSDPAAPVVLGELEIPGVSTYLHPFDATHLIGVGSVSCEDPMSAWLNCVKISLFDVAGTPRLVSEYVIRAAGGSNSEAQYDHKAFLFDRAKELLVIPVQTWSWTPVISDPARGEAWTEYYYSGWSGAFVFEATTAGFTLRGNVSHADENTSAPDTWYYGPSVRRSLYIGDDLYTISDRLVKANRLDTLAEVASVDL